MKIFLTKGICLILLTFCFQAARAQENFMVYWEPEIELSYDVTSLYSHVFSLEKRSLLYRDNLSFDVVQLDFAHFSELKVSEDQILALGIQYRSEAPFGDEKDEFRLTEQYSLTSKIQNFRTEHRFRVEQRFSGRPVEHRLRYQLVVDVPLEASGLDSGETFITGSWENLLTLANTEKPSYEQRFSVEIEFLAHENITFSGGLQYRLDNYTRSAVHNVFILSSASIDL